jgi:hypothetical protein
MISRIHAKQIAKNRRNLERSARIKHNPQFDQRSLIADLALMLVGGVK